MRMLPASGLTTATARHADIRPQPKIGSQPLAPRSLAEWVKVFSRSDNGNFGSSESTKAATAATCGAAIEVPLMVAYVEPRSAFQKVLKMSTAGAEISICEP